MRRALFVSALLAGALSFAPSPVSAQDSGAAPGGSQSSPGVGPGGPGNGPGGPGGPGGGGRRGGGRFNLVDQLKDLLSLTDDQIAKITKIQDDFRAEMQKARDNQDPNADRQKMREEMQARMEKMRGEVRDLLNKDQQAKFNAWSKEQDARRGPGGWGGGRGEDPERQAKRVYDQAAQELKLSDEEKSAVLPLVKKVLDLRAEQKTRTDKRRTDLAALLKTKTAGTDAEKDEIAAKLKEYRKAADDEQAKLKEAQTALREVLTVDNEARLIALGVLD